MEQVLEYASRAHLGRVMRHTIWRGFQVVTDPGVTEGLFRRYPLVKISGQALSKKILGRFAYTVPGRTRHLDRLLRDLAEEGLHALSVKRLNPTNELIHNYASRPQVDLLTVDGVGDAVKNSDELGREIRQRACRLGRPRLLAHIMTQSEICQTNGGKVARGLEHEIFQLNVAVDDPVVVKSRERFEQVGHDHPDIALRQAAGL
mmetsp:Transcript_15450/g.27339  ORF Transcript_15450/g.27339 Transcript_15450/m.27339 type:complete len:204 (+) Transcript_15450:113-724(+)